MNLRSIFRYNYPIMKRNSISAVSLIFILSIVLYANTLGNGFVYDDAGTIVKNALIKDIGNLPKLLEKKAYLDLSGEVTYRPIVTFTYFLDYAIYNLKPWGYHLTNILLHATNGVLFYIFLTLFIKPSTLSEQQVAAKRLISDSPFLISILFIAHPALTEAVNAISFREDLLAFLFYIATLSLYISLRSISCRQSMYLLLYAISCLFYLLSLLSKEMSATLPLIVYCYEWVYAEKKGLRSILLNRRNAGYIAITLAYLYLRFYYFYNPIEKGLTTPLLIERLMTIPWLILSYLKLVIFPVSLSADYEIVSVKSLFSVSFIVPSIFIFSLFALAFASKSREVIFGTLFFIMTLVPVYNVISIGHPFAERYLYLPVIGLMIVAGSLMNTVSVTQKPPFFVYLIIIMSVYSFNIVIRNSVWKDDHSLWFDTIMKMPKSYTSHYNLGAIYNEQNRLNEAIQEYQTALKLKPDYQKGHNGLGLAYVKAGRFDEALIELKAALALKPNDPLTHSYLGGLYYKRGQIDLAILHYQFAIEQKPNDATTLYNLANVYADKGRLNDAIKYYQSALELNPDLTDAHYNIANIYENLNRLEDAIREYKAALRLDPKDLYAHYNLGNVYLKKGLIDEGRKEFKMTLKLKPDFLPARQTLESINRND